MSDSFEPEQGASWARDNWPLSELDAVNIGLDPTDAVIEKVVAEAKQVAASALGAVDETAVRHAA